MKISAACYSKTVCCAQWVAHLWERFLHCKTKTFTCKKIELLTHTTVERKASTSLFIQQLRTKSMKGMYYTDLMQNRMSAQNAKRT